MRTAASIKSLTTLKDVNEELAKQIREVWLNEYSKSKARQKVNDLFGGSGVEYLGNMKRGGSPVYICNAGDTYAPTIGWIGKRMVVCTMGDFFDPVEKVYSPSELVSSKPLCRTTF